MAIFFNSQHNNFKLKQGNKIKSWIKRIVELEKKQIGQIHFVLTSDEELLKINQQFLKHDTYTDIITFDYSENKILSADIMISVDRVGENAGKLKTLAQEELKRVMIHGILHLCGYKDKSKVDSELMRKKENWALKKFE
ncbi:MAG: rRNA maturation RNase YbeY [Bacteroidetes bacterium]|nr:rRNA maturation RNase YbeY [Bacteroidota bacterium]